MTTVTPGAPAAFSFDLSDPVALLSLLFLGGPSPAVDKKLD